MQGRQPATAPQAWLLVPVLALRLLCRAYQWSEAGAMTKC